VKVNGETFDITTLSEATIPALLNHYNLHPERIALEKNGEIIKRAEYSTTALDQGDEIEIIHFVGGG